MSHIVAVPCKSMVMRREESLACFAPGFNGLVSSTSFALSHTHAHPTNIGLLGCVKSSPARNHCVDCWFWDLFLLGDFGSSFLTSPAGFTAKGLVEVAVVEVVEVVVEGEVAVGEEGVDVEEVASGVAVEALVESAEAVVVVVVEVEVAVVVVVASPALGSRLGFAK